MPILLLKKKKLYEKHCVKKAPFISMKTLCENSFSRFSVFGNIRKNESKKKKKLSLINIKNMTYF